VFEAGSEKEQEMSTRFERQVKTNLLGRMMAGFIRKKHWEKPNYPVGFKKPRIAAGMSIPSRRLLWQQRVAKGTEMAAICEERYAVRI
jgi:hypothetical protein